MLSPAAINRVPTPHNATNAKSPAPKPPARRPQLPSILIDERLNLVGRTFLEQEGQDDPHRLFGNRPVDADVGDETPDKFVHGPTSPDRTTGGLLPSLALARLRSTRRWRPVRQQRRAFAGFNW